VIFVCTIAFFRTPIFQVFILYATQFIWIVFLGRMKPMNTRTFNRIVFFNESLLFTCVVWLPFLTDLVITPMNKFITGFGPVVLILGLILIASIFILRELISGLVLCVRQ
jgi:hypothetical protein